MKTPIELLTERFVGKRFSYDDYEEFCEEHNIPEEIAIKFLRDNDGGPNCSGCKHIKNYDLMYPCSRCTRNELFSDCFEKRD